MGRYRRSNWYCGLCGSEFDVDDNIIRRCSRCGTFYGECCALECAICGESFCPECSDGISFICCSLFVCDHCSTQVETDKNCHDCGNSLFKCPECDSFYCSDCDEVKSEEKINSKNSSPMLK